MSSKLFWPDFRLISNELLKLLLKEQQGRTALGSARHYLTPPSSIPTIFSALVMEGAESNTCAHNWSLIVIMFILCSRPNLTKKIHSGRRGKLYNTGTKKDGNRTLFDLRVFV